MEKMPMMKKLAVLVAVIALPSLSVNACATYQDISPKSVPTTVTPGSDDDCKAACANGRALHCVFAESTPGGGSCEEVCHNSETSGYASMHPACIAQAKTCERADDCANE